MAEPPKPILVSRGWQMPGHHIAETFDELRFQQTYSDDMDAARAACFQQLVECAKTLDADAVVGVQVSVNDANGHAFEFVLTGTPVRLSPKSD